MTIFKRGILLLFSALFVLAACRKDDVPVEDLMSKKVVLSAIVGVNGPTSGKINQELTFDVLWHSADSTQRFHQLLDSASRNSRVIKLYTKARSLDSLKTDTAAGSVHYKFKAVSAGTYFLKFYRDNTGKNPIIDTITIK